MSLHREISYVIRDDSVGFGRIGWKGACECGWEGPDHYASNDADKAHIDYRAHVEDALGAGAYYDADVACRNCGSHHRQGILVGTHCTSGVCSQCGTCMLQPDNDVWEESRQQSKLWGF